MAESQPQVLGSNLGDKATADGETVDLGVPTIPGIRWLSDEEAHAMFDAEARQVMGMSGEEFLRRFDAGEFDDMPVMRFRGSTCWSRHSPASGAVHFAL